jgi:hypothetical protein
VSRLSSDSPKISKMSSSSLLRPHQAHREETSEEIKEAELNKVCDLNAAEDAPTECLTDHEEENDGSE